MTKRRIGIPVTYQFSVRYLLHTGLLGRLAQVCQPVVLLDWDEPTLVVRFEEAGAEVRALPHGTMGPQYLRQRRNVELLHEHRLGSPSSAIDWRRRDSEYSEAWRLRRRARRAAGLLPTLLPGGQARAFALEDELLESDTDIRAVTTEVETLRLDGVLSVTPYHRQEDLALRAAARLGLPMVTSIISFDNTTARPWIPVIFDRYLVWNAHNRRELLRGYPQLRESQIALTGAPQFDFYANPAWCWSEEHWRSTLGLPADRPIILYGGGPAVLIPNEPTFLGQLDDAIESGEIAGDPLVIFRRHPVDDQARWDATLGRARHVVVDEPWKVVTGSAATSSADVADIERLVSTLAHSAVHVSTSSTMTVDGAWFDRPQVGPAYDDSAGHPHDRQLRDLYEREHWLPIAASGGMVIAQDRDAYIDGVRRGFTDPAERAAGRRRLLEEIITFTDGRATERVATEVATAFGLDLPVPGPPGAPHPGA